MITTYGICKGLLEAIADYRPLKHYCLKKFKKLPTLYFELDQANPAPRENMPLIVLYQGDISYDEPTIAEREILIGCAIEDSGVPESSTIAGLYRGYRTAEVMGMLVVKAIERYCDERERKLSLLETGEAAVKAYYPYFHAVRTLRIISRRS